MNATPTTTREILRRAVLYTGIVALVIGVVGGVLGYLTVGTDGLWSALMGTGLAILFAVITAVSILAALKYTVTVFFGIIMGAWLLKAVIFMILLAVVTELEFVHPMVLFLSVVAAIVGTLAVDVIVVLGARQSYASNVILPGESGESEADAASNEAANRSNDASPIS